MRKLFTISILILSILSVENSFAQDYYHLNLPQNKFADYDLNQRTKSVMINYYTADDLSIPKNVMFEYLAFNEDGKLDKRILKIYGDYASQTTNKYIYKDGRLDSLITVASAANFNSYTGYTYNEEGQLSQAICRGAYTNYVEDYKFNAVGRTEQIIRTFINGRRVVADYVYDKNTLKKVIETTQDVSKPSETTIFYYANNKVYIAHDVEKEEFIFYDTEYGNIKRRIERNENEAINSYLTSKLYNSKKIDDLLIKGAKILSVDYAPKIIGEDWTKKLLLNNTFAQKQISYAFRKITYASGDAVGSFSYKASFAKEMKIKLEKLNDYLD